MIHPEIPMRRVFPMILAISLIAGCGSKVTENTDLKIPDVAPAGHGSKDPLKPPGKKKL